MTEGIWNACHNGGTILGRHDFVVIVRRWRQQGPVRGPGVWTPAAVADDQELAEVMAALLREDGSDTEARVVSAYELLHRFRSEDRERILDRLNSRTTADIARGVALRLAATARLASMHERRSGRERRSGGDRRSGPDTSRPGGERRSGRDRRLGRDRRAERTA
jgi:hypothetical protein